MSEEMLVEHCAPTMAGIKTANMFTASYDSERELNSSICELNRKFVPKGMCILALRNKDGKALLYFYRPEKLKNDLSDAIGRSILQNLGYPVHNVNRCICELRKRFASSEEFPHEIGLFLGYPAEDVKGFIDNKAGGAKFVGFWKVYGNENAARKTFSGYRKCIGAYREYYAKHRSIDRLLVTLS